MNHILFLHFLDLWSLVIYKESIFLCYSLYGMKVIWIDYRLSVSPYKLISGYLYLPNNLKDMKYHI